MTEMTIYRLNRVPDKTYVHFLNFIGEERRRATAASVPMTFYIRSEGSDVVEIPAYTRCSTRQQAGSEALHFLTTEPITVHDSAITRMVAVRAGKSPMVREISFTNHADTEQALLFNDGKGVSLFQMDAIEHGPRAYTPYQYLYVAHDDFRLMNFDPSSGLRVGRLRIRSANEENLPVGALFKWEYFTADGWKEIEIEEEEEDVLGLPEITMKALLPAAEEVEQFGLDSDAFDIPEPVAEERHWIRGTIDYERWLAHRMSEDLEISWRDDRGGKTA